jgi:hypothetical protein
MGDNFSNVIAGQPFAGLSRKGGLLSSQSHKTGPPEIASPAVHFIGVVAAQRFDELELHTAAPDACALFPKEQRAVKSHPAGNGRSGFPGRHSNRCNSTAASLSQANSTTCDQQLLSKPRVTPPNT